MSFHLLVVLCLPFAGLPRVDNVRGAHLQDRVKPISLASRAVGVTFGAAASALRQCCTARHKLSLAQRELVAKLPRKKVAVHRPLQHAGAAPTTPTAPRATASSGGATNWFPYPSCTWWADQRYYQLHGVYVPWHTQANAWQWVARAYQFGWHVSTRPSVGAIIVLQPWVQGAYGQGHVAVVEQVLSNGKVIASNMNWGGHPRQVANVEFSPGPGVTFITS
jgi:surface antigen